MFYLALVDATDSTWSSTFLRNDLDHFNFNLTHDEGDKARLDVDVRNPQVGLLRPGAKLYCWFTWVLDTTAIPLFFGRLIGVPSNVIGEAVKLSFLADPPDYLAQLQRLAETLRVRPYYDPIFLTQASRDDPHAILEGYSALYHVDRVTNLVTKSSITFGEDGTVEFDGSQVIYDSLKIELGKSPLTVVEVDAEVSWNQHGQGSIELPPETFLSYAGDSMLSGWPKPATSIGGGWFIQSSTAIDTWQVSQALTASWSYEWTNQDKKHANGDVMSVSAQWTVPAIDEAITRIITSRTQPGYVDPFAVDENGDPAPINRPLQVQATTLTVPLWCINTTLTLGYISQRQRRERVRFIVGADLQPVLTYVDQTTNIERISRSGVNVDFQVLNVLDWLAVAGQAVSQGQVIFVPQTLYPVEVIANFQVAMNAGTTGASEPDFSPDAGVSTVSGGVTFAGLGPSLLENTPAWPKNTLVPLGTLIKPQTEFSIVWDQFLPPYPPPLTGATASVGQIIQTNDGTHYHVVLVGGVTFLAEPAWNNTRDAHTISGGVTFQCVGPELPDGTTYWLATTSGITNSIVVPPFSSAGAGTTISDGTAVWTSLGNGGAFIGVPIGDVTRRAYFPTERGLWSLEYLICLASAHLKHRARAVTISWECEAHLVTALSCRKNARVFDDRIPGGVAVGKIMKYGIKLSDEGELVGFVSIGCSIGHGTNITASDGDAGYVDNGYAVLGHSAQVNQVVALPAGDVGYTPPIDIAADDGLVFPLTADQVVIVNQTHGDLGAQVVGINSAMDSAAYAGLLGQNPAHSFEQSMLQQMVARAATMNSVSVELARSPIWKDLQIKPVAGQTFSKEYLVTITNLGVPKTIDLEAA